jgi:hypothetical protein
MVGGKVQCDIYICWFYVDVHIYATDISADGKVEVMYSVILFSWYFELQMFVCVVNEIVDYITIYFALVKDD